MQPEPLDHQAEPLAVLGQVDDLGAGADDRHARRLQRPRQVQRRLAAELDDHPHRLDPLADVEHVLDRQRLEEEPVRGVVVGADGLGVRVDHDDLVAVGPQREGGLAAAVVELDPLADPVGPAAQDHDPRLVADPRLVLVLVGRIIIGRDRLELGGAGVDQLEDGRDPPPLAVAADLGLGRMPQTWRAAGRRSRSAWPRASGASPASSRLADLAEPPLERDQLFDVGQEPGVDPRQRVDLLDATARPAARSGSYQTRSALGVASLALISSTVGCRPVPQRSFLSQPRPNRPTSSPRSAF